MTIGDIIKYKDYDYISYRLMLPDSLPGESIFAGCFKSEGGKIISLDGDSYSENEKVVSYSETENGLEVVVRV